ncbi:MAG: sugar transferase [Ignavibacteriales bacterium]|nr:sugar transferase [Ignavibacteriales bacterium]
MKALLKNREQIALLMIDSLSINAAWLGYYYFRIESKLFAYDIKPDILLPMIVIYLYWISVFSFFGLYRKWHLKSRTDELIAVMKVTFIGVLVLFFLFIYDGTSDPYLSYSRMIIAGYWMLLFVTIGIGRMSLRSATKRLLSSGIGLSNTLIVGWNALGKELHDKLMLYPALGYKVIGFVSVGKDAASARYKEIPLLGSVQELGAVIQKVDAQEVLIALESKDHDALIDIIDKCSGHAVNIKIIPDMYDIISGQARTNQIYGFPLIEIMPHLMQPWEESTKRLMDIVISTLILVVSSPLWCFIGIAIKLDSPGQIVYSQERVGKNEKRFHMHKFRSMRSDAEERTGPVWAPKDDPRVTGVGRFLRNTRLDEIPQFVNVLRGDMSLVGPRPERPHFVEWLAKEIPLYKRRLAVRPGITGWAQIKQGYDASLDDVKSKVRYDLFYIENMSFRMDIKILLMTVYVMIAGKGN